jgi:hypothetical protein
LGDPAKAKAKLGWAPTTTLEEMVCEDLKVAERDQGAGRDAGIPLRCIPAYGAVPDWTRDQLVLNAGYRAFQYHE